MEPKGNAGRMERAGWPLMRTDGVDLMELVLVAAVATVLGVRFFLAATGYPQVGGGGLHIAHVLWGGLLMLAGALVLLGALGVAALKLGALLAGVGFGLFIDEVGKFVTSDVDYFYQPAIAIIYVTFVALALLLATLRRRLRTGPRTALANALALADEAIANPRAGAVRREALALLDGADPDDPLVEPLRARIAAAGTLAAARPGPVPRMVEGATARYRELVTHAWFQRALIAWFALTAASTLAAAGALLVESGGSGTLADGAASALQGGSSLAASALIVVGIWRLRASREAAYLWFQRAMLVSILVTQVFNFYESQLLAVAGLAGSLLIYSALRFALAQEQGPAGRSVPSPA